MTALDQTVDFVQLPADGTGKKSAFRKITIGGVDLYVAANVLTDLAGNLLIGQQLMAASLPVVIASNQSALAVTGTFWQATQPVSIAATLTVDTELAAAAALADATANPTIPGVGSYVIVWNGATWEKLRTPNIFKPRANTSVTALTGATVWTPASGKKFRLMCGELSLSVAGQIIFYDNSLAGTEIFRSPQLQATQSWSIPPIGNGYLSAAANNVLKIDVTSTGTVGGWVGGTEE